MTKYVLKNSYNGSVIGKVTDAVGLTDHKGAKAARRMASDANQAAIELNREQVALMKEQLEFQKDQYADWKDIYGDIQENLGEYYKNLDADDLTAMGLQNQQREYQAAIKTIERDAAQRGISNSGIEYAVKSAATFQNAERRAEIRTNADNQVAQQKLSFLGIGLGQGTAMLGNINNAASNANSAFATGVNSRTNIAGNFLNNATSISNNNTNNMSSMYGTALGFMAGG